MHAARRRVQWLDERGRVRTEREGVEVQEPARQPVVVVRLRQREHPPRAEAAAAAIANTVSAGRTIPRSSPALSESRRAVIGLSVSSSAATPRAARIRCSAATGSSRPGIAETSCARARRRRTVSAAAAERVPRQVAKRGQPVPRVRRTATLLAADRADGSAAVSGAKVGGDRRCCPGPQPALGGHQRMTAHRAHRLPRREREEMAAVVGGQHPGEPLDVDQPDEMDVVRRDARRDGRRRGRARRGSTACARRRRAARPGRPAPPARRTTGRGRTPEGWRHASADRGARRGRRRGSWCSGAGSRRARRPTPRPSSTRPRSGGVRRLQRLAADQQVGVDARPR